MRVNHDGTLTLTKDELSEMEATVDAMREAWDYYKDKTHYQVKMLTRPKISIADYCACCDVFGVGREEASWLCDYLEEKTNVKFTRNLESILDTMLPPKIIRAYISEAVGIESVSWVEDESEGDNAQRT